MQTRRTLGRLTIASMLALTLPAAYAADPADGPEEAAPPLPGSRADCPPPMPGRHDRRGPGAERGGAPGPGAMEEGPMPPFLRGLDLTEAQRDRIFEVTHAQAPIMRQKSKEARKAHEELRDFAMSPQYDEGKAHALAAADAKAGADLAFIRVRTHHEILAVLTPEQRKTVEEMKTRFEAGERPDRKCPPLPPN